MRDDTHGIRRCALARSVCFVDSGVCSAGGLPLDLTADGAIDDYLTKRSRETT